MGEILHIDTASEEITDEFLLFAIKSGLLKHWAASFPDPRHCSEITIEVLLAASIAARYAKLYSLRQTGYVLRSAGVLGELGYAVEVTEAGEGLSSRGTAADSVLSGDVIRKLLVKREAQAQIETAARAQPPPAAEAAQVTVRQRNSRRAVKAQVNEVEAAARACRGSAVGQLVQPECRVVDA